jgi:demethylmenaquinone methyltransferase/2-methoxy-6-polyprenyl-1,4-benzoquinol methylase
MSLPVNESQGTTLPEDEWVLQKSSSQVRSMFHDIAPTYDRLNHLFSMNIDRAWRTTAARLLIERETRNVLDVCSGTGDLALALSRRACELGGNTVIVGTDFTPAMTELAHRKFQQVDRNTGRTPFAAVADTLNLPFADGTFDLVTVAFGIRNVANLEEGLREMRRVCSPSGAIAVLEFSHPSQPLFRWLYNTYFFKILPRVGRLLTGTRAYSYLPKSVAQFPDTLEFTKILQQVTGAPVAAHRLTFGIATLYISHCRP